MCVMNCKGGDLSEGLFVVFLLFSVVVLVVCSEPLCYPLFFLEHYSGFSNILYSVLVEKIQRKFICCS